MTPEALSCDTQFGRAGHQPLGVNREVANRTHDPRIIPLVKTRNPELTRAQLLKAATQEFARYGFHGARVERIVKRADCNMRMLYHYFDNKENLYLKVLEAVYFDIRKKERQLNLDEVEPVEGLHRLVQFTWDHFIANRVFIDITRNENLVSGRFIKRSVVISEMSSPLIALIADIIQRGLDNGQFRHPTDPLQLYISVVALCSHHLNNVHTLSATFQTDLKDPDWLAARLTHIQLMVLRLVGASGERIARVDKLVASGIKRSNK